MTEKIVDWRQISYSRHHNTQHNILKTFDDNSNSTTKVIRRLEVLSAPEYNAL